MITRPTTKQMTHDGVDLHTVIDRLDTDVTALEEVTKYSTRTADTLAILRQYTPTKIGEVVYVRAATETPVGVYGYFGGGYFAAYDNTQANVDDGGVFINSSHQTWDWQRINFTEYDMRF